MSWSAFPIGGIVSNLLTLLGEFVNIICMGSRQGSQFQPKSDDPTEYLGIKTEYTSRTFVLLVNIFNCLAYDWTIKDESEVT
jgi:hypothetical protein